MKRCYQSVAWETGRSFALAGLSLGFDRRAEHVEGLDALLHLLGIGPVQVPVGVADRRVKVSATLRFASYSFEPADKRRRGYPAALLYMMNSPATPRSEVSKLDCATLVGRYDLGFVSEPGQKNHDPSHDLVTAWGAEGFAVHVRGARNIVLLGRLHAALMEGDVAVMAPVGPEAAAVRFVLVSMMGDEDKEKLVEADANSEELLRAAAKTGIHALLAKGGRRYHSLKPEWFDEKQDEVIFFLEPMDRSQANSGWFSVEELEAWAEGTPGPITRDPVLERVVAELRYVNWESRLLRGLARTGAIARYGACLTWSGKMGETPAVRYRATRDTEHIFPSGDYAFHTLMGAHAISVEQDQRSNAQRMAEAGS